MTSNYTKELTTQRRNFKILLTQFVNYLTKTGKEPDPLKLANKLDRLKTIHKSSPNEGVNLPKIELPRFDGKVEKWLSFKDRFISITDKVKHSDIEKIHYLRCALSGDAAVIVEAIDTTASSY